MLALYLQVACHVRWMFFFPAEIKDEDALPTKVYMEF